MLPSQDILRDRTCSARNRRCHQELSTPPQLTWETGLMAFYAMMERE